MDFTSATAASEKLYEEVAELLNAVEAGDEKSISDEAGDVLFSAVNVCRLAGVDCEEVLRDSTKKFTKRFVKCEQLIINDGKDIKRLDEAELDKYWVRAKNELEKN